MLDWRSRLALNQGRVDYVQTYCVGRKGLTPASLVPEQGETSQPGPGPLPPRTWRVYKRRLPLQALTMCFPMWETRRRRLVAMGVGGPQLTAGHSVLGDLGAPRAGRRAMQNAGDEACGVEVVAGTFSALLDVLPVLDTLQAPMTESRDWG